MPNTEIPFGAYWLGQDITKMSREELEAAFIQLGEMYRDTLDQAARRLRVMPSLLRDKSFN